jgi:hypothetical protein
MSQLTGLGFRATPGMAANDTAHLRYVRLSPLLRVLAFTGRSIDEVVNDPIVKREVLGYFKLQKWVQRGCEQVDLERQWRFRTPARKG